MKTELENFIKYVKEKFDQDIEIKPNENPDAFEDIFNGNFLNKNGYEEQDER